MELTKDVVFNLFAVIFFLLFIFSAVYAVWFQPAVSGATIATLLVAAAFCALMGNPDRFQSMKFSLTGIETRAREIIQKAEVSQREFQRLALMTGDLLVDLNAAQGRFASGTGADRDLRKQHILDALAAIGLSKEDVAKAAAADREWNFIDYANGILNTGEKKIRPEQHEEWARAKHAITKGGDTWKDATPEQLHDLLTKFGALDEKIQALIDDFSYYLKTGEQRRPKVWAERYSWWLQ